MKDEIWSAVLLCWKHHLSEMSFYYIVPCLNIASSPWELSIWESVFGSWPEYLWSVISTHLNRVNSCVFFTMLLSGFCYIMTLLSTSRTIRKQLSTLVYIHPLKICTFLVRKRIGRLLERSGLTLHPSNLLPKSKWQKPLADKEHVPFNFLGSGYLLSDAQNDILGQKQ